MTPDDVRLYLDDTHDVEGWFFPVDAYLFAFIDEVQRREGISGNLFEIGVHHGKTAIFLARMRRGSETVGVCDVFDQQELNVDRSGGGSRSIFDRNLRGHELRVFPKLSSELSAGDTTTDCRFFHIDGGHRAEDVVNDLQVASRALRADGIVAVDDVFNPNWPGVSEGFYRFAGEHPDTFAPILIGGNKVLFARPEAAPRYERHWNDVAAAVDAPFGFELKDWLGRRVLTAIRRAWVDLDPYGAARMHAR